MEIRKSRLIAFGFVLSLGWMLPLTAKAVPSIDLADCPLAQPSDTIIHQQTTLGWEFLFECPHDTEPFDHNFITRFFTIENETGRDWLGYDFEVMLDGVTDSLFAWDSNTPPGLSVLGDVSFMDNMVWVNFETPLQPNEDFTVLLRYGEYNGGTTTVNGIAKVPIPSTLALFGLGLAGLMTRRKA
jgi:hypothetical protein